MSDVDVRIGQGAGEDLERALDEPTPPAESRYASLRDRVRQAREESARLLLRPTPVPGVYVAYRSVPSKTLERLGRARGRRHGKNRLPAIHQAIRLLVDACAGVFEAVDGKLVSVDPDDRDGATFVRDDDDELVGEVQGTPLTFTSPRLRELLGVTSDKAEAVVRELYAVTENHDGPVLAAGDAVTRFSELVDDETAEELPGE